MSSNIPRADPYRSFNFRVEIEGIPVASFSEVSGVVLDGNILDYRNGDDPNYPRKLPGLRKFGPITLKNGITGDLSVYNKFTDVLNGQSTPLTGAIVLCNEAQKDVLSYNFTGGFINKIEGAHMLASGNEVAIESAELVVETLTMKLA
jgi:phage tail-like protein